MDASYALFGPETKELGRDVGWSCLSVFLVGFSQSSLTGLSLALQWAESSRGLRPASRLLTLYAANAGAMVAIKRV